MYYTKVLFRTLIPAVVFALSAQAQTFPINGLVAYYPFDGDSNDQSGNGNDGLAQNVTFAANRFGGLNGAAVLAGDSSSYITINTTNLNLNPPFTVSAWAKISGPVSGRIISTSGYELAINAGEAAMNVTDTGLLGAGVASDQQLAVGAWHQIVGVWTTNGGILYTNGQVAGIYATNLHPDYSRGFVPTIGRNSGSSEDSFPGLVDDIHIYSRALSSDEVQQLFTSESTGLVAYYPFNGNANDASGNGINCTVSGAQLAVNRFGDQANSYQFSADPQYLTTSSSVGFPAGTNDFSVSLWIALSFLTNDHQIVFCNAAANDCQLDIWPTSTGTSAPMDFFTGGHYGSPDVHTADIPWVPNQWYSLQIVRSQNMVTVYRNGIVVGQNQTVNGVSAAFGSRYLQFGHGVAPQEHQLYGQLDDIRIYDRALSGLEVVRLYDLESGPRVDLAKAVKPTFRNLTVTTNYQLQVSSDLNTWTNQGSAFSATNTIMVYPQYWDVDNWGRLFFRLQVVP